MTIAERRKTRLSAFFVVCVACFVLSVAYIILFEFAGSDDSFSLIRLAFMVFFSLVTLFIVGVTLLDAIRATKLVRTGMVTSKDVRSSRGRDADSLAQFVVVLDDSEVTVDENTFTKINVGERIVLTTSRIGNNVLDLEVIDASNRSNRQEITRDVIEPMDPEIRRVAWWTFIKSVTWRILVVGLLAFVPIAALIITIGLSHDLASHNLVLASFKVIQVGLPLFFAFLLLRKPFKIAVDAIRGDVLQEVRLIRDVVTSNRRLVGKTGLMSGWGDVTTYTYVDTGEAFLLCSPLPQPSVGKQVVISRLPLSRVVLGVYTLE
ncbi:MAG: hypothetical protein SGJ05_00180 [bacterium]|nr:hypothetical protein [bacterium]